MMHGLPVLFIGLVTVHDPVLDTGFRHPATFTPQLLALVRAEAVEKIIEVAIPRLGPVVLAAQSQQQTGVLQAVGVNRVGKQPVQRGQALLAGQFPRSLDQRPADRFGIGQRRIDQQPPAGRGGIGHGHHRLRVPGHAGAFTGIGPGPVEDELTVGVGLEVQRHGADQSALVVKGQQVMRQPAEGLADAAVMLQRGQKGVAQEGIALRVEPVPVGGGDGVDAVGYLNLH